MEDSSQITILLKNSSDPEVLGRIISFVYYDLRRIANSYFRGNSNKNTLQPTALIHEVYLHLVGKPHTHFKDKNHFLNTAALIMRQLLAKYARGKQSRKRGGPQRDQTFDEALNGQAPLDLDYLVDIQRALAKLEALDARKAAIVELRLYLGFSVEECAQALGVTSRTIRRDWTFLRTWLARELKV